MSEARLLVTLRNILAQNISRDAKAERIAEAIRVEGSYRWVGIYDVDVERGLVSNVAWSGPGPPAYPVFPSTKGLTSKAIAGRKTINVGDVDANADYLTAFATTRAEMIIPILDTTGDRDIGTIDVESEHLNAFDSAAETLLEECAVLLSGFWTVSHR
jgi:putative methionine-R-sulfoxide reductase with GAF domain